MYLIRQDVDETHKQLKAEFDFWQQIITAWSKSKENQGYQSIRESYRLAQISLLRYERAMGKKSTVRLSSASQ